MATTAAVPGWLRVPDDANALAPQVWPERAHRDADGRLVVAGVAATELAERFGTPLYVVDESDARARAARILAAFEAAAASVDTTVTVYYAGKAFLSARDRALGHRGRPRRRRVHRRRARRRARRGRRTRAHRIPRQQQVGRRDRARGGGRRRRDHHRQRGRDRAGRGCRGTRRPGPARAAAGEQRRARVDARVPRHRPRGPEVRRLPRPRRRARHAHPLARLARPPGAALPHRLPDLRLRRASPSRPSACSPRTPSSRPSARCPS